MTVESRSVVVRLSAEASAYIGEMQAAGTLGADAMTKVEKSALRSSAAVDKVGRSAGQIGLLAAAGVATVVFAAARFDKAMSAVDAATHESTHNMDLLRQAALDAGQRTVFSATEAAGAIEELGKAGVSTADILSGALNGALDLAAAGSLAVGDAAEYIATSLNQFSLEGKEATHVADLLAAGAGKAQGEVSDMALALSYAGVPAANLGVSIEETAGSIALLAANGIIGEKAGTSLRGMLASLTSPSKVAQKTMDELGISVFDASGNFIGMAGVAAQLHDRLGSLTEQERAYALGKIFGNEQLQAANILYREGADAVQQWTTAVDDQGYAADTAARKLDNLMGDLEQLGGAVETLLIGTGEGAQSPLRGTVQLITAIVNGLNAIPSEAKGSFVTLSSIAAIVGGATWLGAKVIGKVGDFNASLKSLAETAPKTARSLQLLARTGALVAGLEIAGIAIDTIRDKAIGAGPPVEQLTAALVDANNAEFNKQFGSGLIEALDALNQSGIDGLAQELNNLADKGGSVGRAIEVGLASFTGMQGQLEGVRTETGEAAKAFESLDAALAGLVSTGGAEQARVVFDQLVASQGLSAEQQQTLIKQLPQYKEALAGAATEAKLNTGATDDLTSATYRLRDGTEVTAEELDKIKEAYQDARDAARGVAEEFFNLGDSLDDSKVSLGEWIHDMEEQAAALRDFRRNAEEAADKGLREGLIEALEDAGPAGALRMKQLANATDEEIDRANRAWKRGQDEIDKYVDATTEVPKELTTAITVESAQALQRVRDLGAALSGLNDKTIYITTVERTIHQEDRLAGQGAGGSGGGHGSQPPKRTYTGASGRTYAGSSGLLAAGAAPKMTVLGGGTPSIPQSGLPPKYGGIDPGLAVTLPWNASPEIKAAVRGFAPVLSQGSAEIRAELRDLRRSLKDAGGVWNGAIDKQAHKLLALAGKYDAQADALDRSRQALDDLYAAQASYAQQVGGLFSASPFGQGLDFFDALVGANTNDSTSWQGILQQLIDQGLDGPLLQQLAASGDMATAMQLLATGPAGIALREQAFQAMLDAQQRSGWFAAGQVFGNQITNQQQVVADNAAALRDLKGQMQTTEQALTDTVKAVNRFPAEAKDAVRDGAKTGAKQGVKEALGNLAGR